MTRENLAEQSEMARVARASLPAKNYLPIADLAKMPKFFDWVECGVGDQKFLMYLAGADDGVALKFFWNGQYEGFTLALWSYLASKTEKINIDVGAHTGAYTLSAKAAGAANVLCFEPHFANFSRLMMNLRANGFSLGHAYMLAVGERDGWNTFNLPTNLDYLSTGGTLLPKPGGNKFPVQTVRLDRIITESQHKNVGVMKIDVEGFEVSVLRGAERIVNESRPVIFFECIDEAIGSAVEGFLRAYGYNFYLLDDANGSLSKIYKVQPEFDRDGKLCMSKLNRLAAPVAFDESLGEFYASF